MSAIVETSRDSLGRSVLSRVTPTDAVVRTQYYKYFHPKECYISNGILNRQLGQLAGKTTPGIGMDDDGNNPQ